MKPKRKINNKVNRKPHYFFLMLSVISIVFWLVLLVVGSEEKLEIDWSPDGEWLVFYCGFFTNSNSSSNSSLYIMRPDGSQLQRITTDRYLAKFPSWSPDGRWIAFATDNTIYKIRPDGTDLIQIKKMNFYDKIYSLDWSSTSEWIAYSIRYGGLNSGYQILKVSAKTGEVVRIHMGEQLYSSVKWSPDDSKIAFVAQSVHSSGIYTITLSDYEVEQILSHSQLMGQLNWGISNNQLMVTLHDYDNWELYQIDIETGNRIRVDLLNFFGSPTMSLDGEWITYVGTKNTSNIYKAKMDGSDMEQLTNFDSCFPSQSQWYDFREYPDKG